MPKQLKEQLAVQTYSAVPRRQSAPQYRQPYSTNIQQTRKPPNQQRQTADVYDEEDEEDDDDLYPQRSRSSVVVRRPYQPIARQTDTEPEPPEGKKQKNWLFSVSLVVSIMLAGWLLFSMLGSWIHTKMDDFTYGFPRTYQVDQDVGHFGRVSHFLCLNLNGEIEVLETQKGHPEVAKIYVVVVLPQDQAGLPVTISFQDINADGKLDALVHYGSTEIPLYNNGTTFQSQPPAPK